MLYVCVCMLGWGRAMEPLYTTAQQQIHRPIPNNPFPWTTCARNILPYLTHPHHYPDVFCLPPFALDFSQKTEGGFFLPLET